jgi:TPP-dependent pyruvate/acetoin dehydrogenase alpha subunit
MTPVWRGFGIPVEEFDGNDPEVTYATVCRALDHARSGAGPVVLEGLTYRLDPHIWYDPADYQPQAEIARWRERDPIAIARRHLLERGVAADRVRKLEQDSAREVDEIMREAEQAPWAGWSDNAGAVLQ